MHCMHCISNFPFYYASIHNFAASLTNTNKVNYKPPYLALKILLYKILSNLSFFQVKITSNNEDMLRSACEQFADKKVGDIQDIARFLCFF